MDPASYPLLTPARGTAARGWHVANTTVYLQVTNHSAACGHVTPVLPLIGLHLQPELLAPVAQYEYHRALEFVAINPNFAGKKYRYRMICIM